LYAQGKGIATLSELDSAPKQLAAIQTTLTTMPNGLPQHLTSPLPCPLPPGFVEANLPVLMCNWLSKPFGSVRLELLYRATLDGFAASDFHDKCNDKGETVTVITSSEGYVFGGYADLAWLSDANMPKSHRMSQSAFLFSIICAGSNVPAQLKLSAYSSSAGVVSKDKYGPTFGCYDIHVSSMANTSGLSFTNRDSYEVPGELYFTGARNFLASEVEVYQVSIPRMFQ
jgi:hypothetical protein